MKWILWLFGMAFLISCSEETPLKTVFSISVDQNYKQFESQIDSTYIIIQTTDGDLLNFRRVEPGGTLKFDTPSASDKIDITIARVYADASGGGLANVWTYLDVPAGQAWTLRYDQVIYGPARHATEVGSYSMIFNNIDPVYALSISDHLFSVTSRRTSSPLGLKAGIRQDVPKQLLSLHNGNGSPRYKFIEPKLDETYTIDYNTMTPFDTVISVSLSEPGFVYAHVMGYETMDDFRYLTGFVLYDNIASASSKKSSISLGYLDNMTRFRTELSVSNGKANVVYISRGKYKKIFLPRFDDVVLQERSADNVTYSSKIDLAYRISWFVSGNYNPGTNGTSWYFHAPPGRSRQPKMPEEFLMKFPKLGATTMRHANTTFYTTSWPYETFLEREFGNVRKAEEDEYEDIALVLN